MEGSAIGVDVSAELLEVARRRSAEAGLRNAAFELGDAQVAFTTASAQDVQARFNLSSARAQLMAALGVR